MSIFLWVVLSTDFKWDEHTACVEKKKPYKKLGFLGRALHKFIPKLKFIAYNTFICLILEYSSVVWDPHSQVNINTLEMIQRKAISYVFNRYSYLATPSELLKRADLDTLEVRRQHVFNVHVYMLKYMFLIYHNKLWINKDAYIETVHRRYTCTEHPKKLKDYSCKTTVFKNSFF